MMELDHIFTKYPKAEWSEGRCISDRESIGRSSLGRKCHIGKHWYNNGKEQKMCFKCPPGFAPGTLPMSDEAKLSHKIAGKNSNLTGGKIINRGYKTLSTILLEIDFNEFKNDYLMDLSDKEIKDKYNLTDAMYKKYRLFKKLLKDSKGRRYYGK